MITGPDEAQKKKARDDLQQKLALVFAPLALEGNPVPARWRRAVEAIKSSSTPAETSNQKFLATPGSVVAR